MPTIEISQKTLERLVGRKVGIDDYQVVKGSLEMQEGDKIKLEIGDSNRPDLWSVEGVARVLRGYHGLSKGIPHMKMKKSGKKIIVNSNIKPVRPFIAGFIVKNVNVTEELLLDIIQLQEKICDNYGRKRQRVSIGVYDYNKIEFPVYYKAIDPDKMSFTPLEFEKAMTLSQILEEHPKGIQYGYVLKDHKLYPIFVDSKDDVLSFPPIINSNYIGKVEPGSNNLFMEVTGTDMKTVLIATNIFAYAMSDRGAEIESVSVAYPWKTRYGKVIETPYIFKEKVSFSKARISEMLGISLADGEVKKLLEKMQYNASVGKNVTVEVAPYRNDVMHYVDIIEDIAIAYGYGKFSSLGMCGYTPGKLSQFTEFMEKCRLVMIGLGFQEIASPLLTSKIALDNMRCHSSLVEIDNVMSESYSVVRPFVMPSLMSCLSKNMHNDYPQRIFELGECAQKNGEIKTTTRMAVCMADTGCWGDF
ncbi:MAG: phenylalanine--tRNA ligase subunit beta [Candidatus Aenigmarchaeota archaeon]|nr:phenylalanine--tRNA ligase subunit beta [Candidatus Aenigmarchaeota archaeon]